MAGLGGVAAVAGGAIVGRGVQGLTRPDAQDVQEAAATDIGGEYMELVARASHPGRSGDLQLLLAPFAAYAGDRFPPHRALALGYGTQATAMAATAIAINQVGNTAVILAAALAVVVCLVLSISFVMDQKVSAVYE